VYGIGHGTEIVELIGVRHRTKIARALGHLFVIAMQISENRLELAHDLTFDSQDGAWSYIGTDCRSIPLNEATMNLGFLDGGTAAHEFGHALGLAHEHQNPAGGIQWNEEVVIRECAKSPNFCDEETTCHENTVSIR
jgi:hypothetical protein